MNPARANLDLPNPSSEGQRANNIEEQSMTLAPHEAADIVIKCVVQMADEGRPLMNRVLPGDECRVWDHYPDDDARDAVTGSRWYYHVHEPGDRDPAEHGHFHLFLHRDQIAPSCETLAAPDTDAMAAPMVHIAGLSIDHQGVPIAWFATNRWVTDEFLYPAETVIAHLDRYDVDNTEEDDLTNRLLTAMVALYRNDLADLLRQRDKMLKNLKQTLGDDVYEQGHDVIASAPIDLDAKIDAIGESQRRVPPSDA